MSDPLPFGFLRSERSMVSAALALVTAAAWIHLAWMALHMNAAPDSATWSAASFGATFAMWVVMMIGMMIPSAAPAILLHASLHRRGLRTPRNATAFFVLGYLVAWSLFSAFATIAQWALSNAGLLTPDAASQAPLLDAIAFIAAGLYQFSPAKRACLAKCRDPARFFVEHWREGRYGALIVGAEHGAYCVGCCWVIMALLFVFGVMNLVWVAALAALVLAEKLLPSGQRIATWGGVAMAAIGILFLIT